MMVVPPVPVLLMWNDDNSKSNIELERVSGWRMWKDNVISFFNASKERHVDILQDLVDSYYRLQTLTKTSNLTFYLNRCRSLGG